MVVEELLRGVIETVDSNDDLMLVLERKACCLFELREKQIGFFIFGLSNCTRYGLYYLCTMERLPIDVLTRFLKVEHVMHHKSGFWNRIMSNMYIETTFMCYGHSPG